MQLTLQLIDFDSQPRYKFSLCVRHCIRNQRYILNDVIRAVTSDRGASVINRRGLCACVRGGGGGGGGGAI